MSRSRPLLPCPQCGTPMNHHADKIVEPVDAAQAARIDPALGGVLHAAHACPQCGHVELLEVDPRVL